MVTRMDSVYNYVLCDCVLRKCRYTCGVWALRGLSAVTCVRRGGGEKTPAKPASRPAAARPALYAGSYWVCGGHNLGILDPPRAPPAPRLLSHECRRPVPWRSIWLDTESLSTERV